ncbi:hypothetical protein SPFM15_00247 [Salmonella phage SPFM15]|nr:hypothetical protein SPFM5_00241 [Salmonella phage SPFM5]VFR13871.1 hypothetical protein SPFM15_00247 [Salmonella phage SPFM15]
MNVDNVPPGEILRKGLEGLSIIPHAEFDGAYGDLEKNSLEFRVEDISEIDLLTMYAVPSAFVFMNLPAEPDLTVVQQNGDDERQERIVTYLRLFPENRVLTVMENFLAAESLESQKRRYVYGDENLHFEDLITVVSPALYGIVSSGETPEYILENMCETVRILHGVLEAFEEFEDSDGLGNRLGIGLNPQIVFQKPKLSDPADETVRLESIIVKVAVVTLGMDYGYDVALSDVYSNPYAAVLTVNRHEGRAAPMLDLALV